MIKKREILGVLFEFKALLAASFPTALGRACLKQNFTPSGRLSQFVISSSHSFFESTNMKSPGNQYLFHLTACFQLTQRSGMPH